jgi:tetratricopeptide (TPR) repeat protein
MAASHQRLGQRHAAADALFALANLHREQQNWPAAIDALRRVVKLHDGHLRARFALTEIYTEQGQSQRAITEYLGLARMYEAQGHTEKALDQCRQALRLDASHHEARALLEALRRGEPVAEVTAVPEPPVAGISPADLAREEALQELASLAFEDAPSPADAGMGDQEGRTQAEPGGVTPLSRRPETAALVASGVDYQTRGLAEDAIASYTRAIEMGVERPALYLCLGLLYQQRLRFREAIAALSHTVESPDYHLGGRFALGQCYQALGLLDDAVAELVQVIKVVDVGLARQKDVGALDHLYEALAASYTSNADPDRALEFVTAAVQFLTTPGWKETARQARQRLDDMAETGEALSLAEVVVVPGSDAILKALSKSREYAERGAFSAAIELCYEALESAPAYLPLHARLAEILAESGAVDEAIAKYQTMAELHQVRGEPAKAIDAYERMVRLRPMDVVIHSRLIDLLTSSGEIDLALEQYVALADTYYELAQVDKALETVEEALRLAPRATETRPWRLRLLGAMTDYEMRRGNWRQASEIYRQMVSLAPDNAQARLGLIDVYFKLGRVSEADRETVSLLEYFRDQDEPGRALALLNEAVRLQPNEMPLRARLAQAYVDAGLREEAVRHLDALGELQLDAGFRHQAMSTVRYIISLEPENVDEYRQLLSRL